MFGQNSLLRYRGGRKAPVGLVLIDPDTSANTVKTLRKQPFGNRIVIMKPGAGPGILINRPSVKVIGILDSELQRQIRKNLDDPPGLSREKNGL